MNVSLVTFLKNEYSDIIGWICWHLSMGFDHIFIYEDGSIDGTKEILDSLSKVLPITIIQTDSKKEPSFYNRQKNSFMEGIEVCSGYFDWVALLDGDEYIFIEKSHDIKSFLNNFPDAAAVEISWCIYGGNGRVLRPKHTTPEAFLTHSTSELEDNYLVKSIVRPEKVIQKYKNPHCFDVGDNYCYSSSGKKLNGSNPHKEIEWNDAKIMHYICRSFDHFSQRILRRIGQDLHDHSGGYYHFDKNDIEDKRALKYAHLMYPIIFQSTVEIVKDASNRIRNIAKTDLSSLIKIEKREINWLDLSRKKLFIKTHDGRFLHCSKERNRVYSSCEEDRSTMLQAYILFGATNTIHFTASASMNRDIDMLNLDSDPRKYSLLSYEIQPVLNENKVVVFKSRITGQYITAGPKEWEEGDNVTSDRWVAQEWEYFRLIDSENMHDVTSEFTKKISDCSITINEMFHHIKSHINNFSDEDIIALIGLLSKEDRIILNNIIPGVFYLFS